MAEKENQSGSGKSKKILFILGLIFLLIFLTAGGYFLFKCFSSSSLTSPSSPTSPASGTSGGPNSPNTGRK